MQRSAQQAIHSAPDPDKALALQASRTQQERFSIGKQCRQVPDAAFRTASHPSGARSGQSISAPSVTDAAGTLLHRKTVPNGARCGAPHNRTPGVAPGPTGARVKPDSQKSRTAARGAVPKALCAAYPHSGKTVRIKMQKNPGRAAAGSMSAKQCPAQRASQKNQCRACGTAGRHTGRSKISRLPPGKNPFAACISALCSG